MNSNSAANQALSKEFTPLSAKDKIILQECRDFAAQELKQSLVNMLIKLEDSLFALAEKSTDRNSANLYLEARGIAQSNKKQLVEEFQRAYVEQFTKKMNGEKEHKPTIKSLDSFDLQLSLVANDDFEETLIVSKMATQFRAQCPDELNALDQRVALLLKQTELKENENPFSPQVICEALKIACNQINASTNIKQVFFNQFQHLLAKQMPTIYHGVNDCMIERNVLPTLPAFTVRRTTRPQQTQTNNFGFGASGATGGSMQMPHNLAQFAQYNEQMMAQMPEWMQNNQNFDSFNEQTGGISTERQQQLFQAFEQFLSKNEQQAAALENQELTTGSALHQAALLASLDSLQQQADLASVAGFKSGSILHHLKQNQLKPYNTGVDAMVIDMIALLFDYILADKSIATEFKALIARLQIPILKVAVRDNKFFSKKQHPARRCLDSLAEAGLGWHADAHNSHYPIKLASIIDVIVDDLSEEVQIYENTLKQLTEVIEKETALAKVRAEEEAKAKYEKERAELCMLMAKKALKKLYERTPPPDDIRAFLDVWWAKLLAESYAQGGEASLHWRAGLSTLDVLLWSIQPKTTIESRNHLVKMLPRTLKQVEAGLRRYSEENAIAEKTKFFNTLMVYHAEALKQGMRFTPNVDSSEWTNGTQAAYDALSIEGTPDTTSVDTANPVTANEMSVVTEKPLPIKNTAAATTNSRITAATVQKTSVSTETKAAPVMKAVIQDSNFTSIVDTHSATEKTLGETEPATGEKSHTSSLSNTTEATSKPSTLSESIKRGSWIEITNEKGVKQAMKLAWVSPLKGVYLFTNRNGQNAINIEEQDLQERLKDGRARILLAQSTIDLAAKASTGH